MNVQELIEKIDTTYRNVYSVKQKVEWMDNVQRQLFQEVPKESIPFEYITLTDMGYYELPDDCDRHGIKSITIEDKPGSRNYIELPHISSSSNIEVNVSQFYTLLDGMFMIYPTPTADTANKSILMLYTQRAPKLDFETLDQVPALEEDFHQLLVYGVCLEMAVARGETEDMNIFTSRFETLFSRYKKIYSFTDSEYKSINDVLPKRRKRRGLRRSQWAR